MNKYKDVIESELVEFVETPEDKLFLAKAKIKWGKSDERNKNNRLYPDAVASAAIEKFNKETGKSVGVVGQLDHPIGSSSTLLSNASHLVSKVWKDDKKVWWAEVKVFDTGRGRDLMTILKSGTKIGSSLRGFGETDKDGKVKPGLEVRAIDFVSSPSFGASATVSQSNVFESFVPEEEYQFNNDDLKEITSAMDTLNDKTIKLVQEKLEKDENIIMTEGKVKALSLWIRMSKDNPNIAPFNKWFDEQQKLFAQNDPNLQEELNDELRREANRRAEKRLAESPHNANTLFVSRKRIEARQKEIDDALKGKRMSEKTISRLFAEACLAGFKGTRAEWIEKFGF